MDSRILLTIAKELMSIFVTAAFSGAAKTWKKNHGMIWSMSGYKVIVWLIHSLVDWLFVSSSTYWLIDWLISLIEWSICGTDLKESDEIGENDSVDFGQSPDELNGFRGRGLTADASVVEVARDQRIVQLTIPKGSEYRATWHICTQAK